jgi:cellulose synthase (UDP-forming)
MIRLAMYTEVYCSKDRDLSLELLEKGIDAAIRADMYVLVDWHILEDYDPNIHKTEALEFFEYISG